MAGIRPLRLFGSYRGYTLYGPGPVRALAKAVPGILLNTPILCRQGTVAFPAADRRLPRRSLSIYWYGARYGRLLWSTGKPGAAQARFYVLSFPIPAPFIDGYCGEPMGKEDLSVARVEASKSHVIPNG